MPTRIFAAALFAASFGLLETPFASAVVIDDFSVGAFDTVSYGRTLEFSQQSLFNYEGGPSPLGFGRDGSVRGFLRGNVPGRAASLSVTHDTQLFEFQAEADAFGYFDLEWTPQDAEGGETFDLTADGADRFRLRFAGSDNTIGMSLSVTSLVGDNEIRSHVPVRVFGFESLSNEIVEIPYDSFFGDSDFSRVTQVALSTGRFRGEAGFALDVISTEAPPLDGDYDRDGDVDLEDLDVWVNAVFNVTPGVVEPYAYNGVLLSMDGNADGFVDVADYTVWRDAYSGDAVVQTTPEPTTLVLLTVCLASAAGGRAERG